MARIQLKNVSRRWGNFVAVDNINLDIADAMAWVLVAVIALIAVEYCLIRPVHSEIERRRDAARPWGIKRGGIKR